MHTLGAEQSLTFGCGGAVGPDGALYLMGTTNGGLDREAARGMKDVFLARFTADGRREWIVQLGAPAPWPGIFLNGCAVDVDSAGNAYLAGGVNGAGTLEGQQVPSLYSGFVASVDPQGAVRWFDLIGDSGGSTEAMGLELLAADRLAVVGYTQTGWAGGQPQGSSDVFVAFYGRDGTREKVVLVGGAGEDVPSAFDAEGDRLFLATRVLSGVAGAVQSQQLRVLNRQGEQVDEVPFGVEFVIQALSATQTGLGVASVQQRSDGSFGTYRLEYLSAEMELEWSAQPVTEGRRFAASLACHRIHGCLVGGDADAPPDTRRDTFISRYAPGGELLWSRGYVDGAESTAASRVAWLEYVAGGEAYAAGFTGSPIGEAEVEGFAAGFGLRIDPDGVIR